MFEALEVAVEMTREIREIVEAIHKRSAPLADQLRRAVESVALNLGEARWRSGKDRSNRYRIAAGSAQEAHTALRLAEAWGYVRGDRIERVLSLLDRLLAMLWKLTRR